LVPSCVVTVSEHIIEGNIERMRRRRRRCEQILDCMGKKRCWKFREEALDRTVWRTCFGRPFANHAMMMILRMEERGSAGHA